MEELILFIVTYIVVFIIYQLFIVSKAKKNKEKNNKKEPFEVLYLKKMYKKLDFKKISYNQLLQLIAIISSFDISLVIFIITRFDNFLLEILIGFVSTLLIIIISYHLIYLFYKKKGMIKNG